MREQEAGERDTPETSTRKRETRRETKNVSGNEASDQRYYKRARELSSIVGGRRGIGSNV